MHFTKMHGLGNDYLYVYGEVPPDAAALSVRLSERHFGAGSDGMIYITPSETADFGMRIFNADGSEAMMCGNGIRCVGKYVYDKGYTDKTHLQIETLSGIRTLSLQTHGGKVESAAVGMGLAVVGGELTLAVSTGKVEVRSAVCEGAVDVTVSTGRAILADISCKSFRSEGDTGELLMEHVIVAEQILIARSTGGVRLERCDAAELLVTTDTGDVTGTLLSEKVFITQSNTGSVSVPETTTGGKCKITTDTGDIRITLQ